MRILIMVCLAVISLVFFSSPLISAEKPSVEHGKKLFYDPTLGGSTNDANCGKCHSEGSGLETAGERKDLGKMINRCITNPIAGKALADDSSEMQNLKAYIKSLGQEVQPEKLPR